MTEIREYLETRLDWDRETRQYIYSLYDLGRYRNILNIGAGNGMLAKEIKAFFPGARVVAMDDEPLWKEEDMEGIDLIVGGIDDLRGEYDAIVFRFYLMWQSDMFYTLEVLKNHLSQGGVMLALAEPDYGGRIELPPGIETWLMWSRAIKARNGNPFAGRYLYPLFRWAGMRDIHTGISSRMRASDEIREDFDALWDDLFHHATKGGLPVEEWSEIKEEEWSAIENGNRYVFTPIFWCAGRK